MVEKPPQTHLNGLTEEQRTFILENGPGPKDKGAVKSFTKLFVRKFNISIPFDTMCSLLSKTQRKKRRARQTESKNDRVGRPWCFRNHHRNPSRRPKIYVAY